MRARALIVSLSVVPFALGCSATSGQSAPETSGSASSSAVGPASSSTASPSTPASSTPTSGGGASSASATASSTSATSAKRPADTCKLIPLARLNQLFGSSFSTASAGTGGDPCTYNYKQGEKVGRDVAMVNTVSDGGNIPFKTAASSLGTEFKLGHLTRIKVPGADDAYALNGTSGGLVTAAVIAKHDNLLYVSISGGERSATTYVSGLTKVVGALVSA